MIAFAVLAAREVYDDPEWHAPLKLWLYGLDTDGREAGKAFKKIQENYDYAPFISSPGELESECSSWRSRKSSWQHCVASASTAARAAHYLSSANQQDASSIEGSILYLVALAAAHASLAVKGKREKLDLVAIANEAMKY